MTQPYRNIQLQRDTSSNWTTYNPILLEGELGIETDTRRAKIGDGITNWNSIPFAFSGFIGDEVALLSGNQSIAGVKTFTSPLITNGAINFNAPEGFMVNGKIVPSVASGNLTLTLTGTSASLSATNPCYLMIGGVTRMITSNLVHTHNSGNNIFNLGSAELATKEVDLFAYLFYYPTSSTLAIAYSRLPYATSIADFNYVATNEKGFDYGYDGNLPPTTQSVVNIGRFAATLSAGAGYTWSIPTYTSSNLIQRPIYETRWLDWTPTITWIGTAPTSPGTLYAKYKIISDTTFVKSALVYGTNGSSNTALDITIPFSTPNDGFINKLINGGFNNNYDTPISCKTFINRTASNVINSYGSSTTANNFVIEGNYNI